MTGPTRSPTDPIPVLVCGDARIAGALAARSSAVVIDRLCDDPSAGAAAIGRLRSDRVVLALCDGRPSQDHIRALAEAGIDPFGIEAVALAGRSETEAAALLTGAVAKLARLAPDEPGRPAATAAPISRRALFMLRSASVKEPIAVVEPAVCVGVRRCGVCVAGCPEDAIDASDGCVTVLASACTACGRCVRDCPVDAIHLSGASREQIEAQLESLVPAFPRIVIACRSARARAPEGWGLIELPTLGIVTPGWLLALRARGVQVAAAPCEGPCCARIADVFALSARIEVSVSDPVGPGSLRLREPQASVAALAAPSNQHLQVESPASPLGVLEVDADRCSLCGACASACPTGAIVRVDTGAVASLTHDARACSGCGVCVRNCPEDALAVRLAIDVDRLDAGAVTVATAALDACTGCGEPLPPLPLRRRVNELLGRADEPAWLCAACSTRRAPAASAARRGRAGQSSS